MVKNKTNDLLKKSWTAERSSNLATKFLMKSLKWVSIWNVITTFYARYYLVINMFYVSINEKLKGKSKINKNW